MTAQLFADIDRQGGPVELEQAVEDLRQVLYRAIKESEGEDPWTQLKASYDEWEAARNSEVKPVRWPPHRREMMPFDQHREEPHLSGYGKSTAARDYRHRPKRLGAVRAKYGLRPMSEPDLDDRTANQRRNRNWGALVNIATAMPKQWIVIEALSSSQLSYLRSVYGPQQYEFKRVQSGLVHFRYYPRNTNQEN